MKTVFDFSRVSVSWTKYDIVRVLDLVENRDVMMSYYSGDSPMDPSVLRSALLLRQDDDSLPEFWDEVLSWDLRIRRYFMFFLILFSNGKEAQAFSSCYEGAFRGSFLVEGYKVHTNLRSLLIESGLSSLTLRRAQVVPFDGSILLNEVDVGPVFRRALSCYIDRNSIEYDEEEFDEICSENAFYRIVGMSQDDFRVWLAGHAIRPASIKSFSFDSFLCFDQPCQLAFDGSQEVYFVGENGDGKTLMLMAIFMALRGYRVVRDEDPKYVGAFRSVFEKVRDDSHLRAIDDHGQVYLLDSAPFFPTVFAYGVHRGRYASESDLQSFEQCGFMTLFDIDLTLRDPVDWLIKSALEHPGHPELEFDGLQLVLNEVLERNLEIKKEGAKLSFWEKGMEVSFSELSEGYRSTIIFICDLLIRLSKSVAPGENVFMQPGVVLIDEIGLHLHPKWQFTLVNKLRKLFPYLQFIMTTHSPVILLGAGRDALFYRVYREKGHTFVSEPYWRKDLDGMMLNTLVTSSLFDLESAAMSGSGSDVDTSDNYTISRINSFLDAQIKAKKREGKRFFTNKELDEMISSILEKYSGE